VFFVPPSLTMMHLCITQCTYWTPLTAGKTRGTGEAMAKHHCQRAKKTIMKQGDIIPIVAIYFHTRFLLASITIYFIISCITILTDDKIYVIHYE